MGGGWANPLQSLSQGLVLMFRFTGLVLTFRFTFDPELDKNSFEKVPETSNIKDDIKYTIINLQVCLA